MKTIQISCDTKDTLDWRVIKPLQGNYKKRTPEQVEKLCNLIIKRGIRFPSFITKIGDEVWAIDTHGRLLAYEELEKRDYIIPPVPVVYINSKSKKEAKQLLLECDSRYGTASQEGFDEFVDDLDISVFDDEADMNGFFNNLELPEIFGLERQELSLDVEDSDFIKHEELIKKLKLCPNCGAEL
ncbi:hypothetical protein FACS189468_8690 [Spirochaetia bacterium]|nr:hypothetical protein FACS189468_8690 [Spirochaetia bacterium]